MSIIIESLRCIPEPRILNVNYPVIKNLKMKCFTIYS